jgi:hypothetical protein
MNNDDIKQRRRCRCCNQQYDYAVAYSVATRFICQECAKLPEPLRRVLINFNKRLSDLETQVKSLLPKKEKKEVPAHGLEKSS